MSNAKTSPRIENLGVGSHTKYPGLGLETRIFNVRLVQRLDWVFKTTERKKERKKFLSKKLLHDLTNHSLSLPHAHSLSVCLFLLVCVICVCFLLYLSVYLCFARCVFCVVFHILQT